MTSLRAPLVAQSAVIDLSFSTGTGFTSSNGDPDVRDVALAIDGGYYVVGKFNGYNGTTAGNIIKLFSDGSVDPYFAPISGANERITCVTVLDDGTLMIGGKFSQYDGVQRNGIARILPTGLLDISFNPGLGALPLTIDNPVLGIEPYPGTNKLIVFGEFHSYNTEPGGKIVRINADGSQDFTFDTPTFYQGTVVALDVQPDGKVVFGAENLWLTPFGGSVEFARLLADGSWDMGFEQISYGVTPVSEWRQVRHVEVLPSGKVVALTSRNLNGEVVRFNSDGTRDPSFYSLSGALDAVGFHWWTDLEVLADGRILVLGEFTNFNGAARNRIVRLTADGFIDPSFDPGSGFNSMNYWYGSILVQPDGKVVCGGEFDTYQGYARHNLVRIGTGLAVRLFTDVFLAGAFQPNFPGLMRSDLYPAGMMPLQEPYSGLGFQQMGSGGESISLNTFPPQPNNPPVDWVFLELRYSQNPTQLIATRSALLLNNGQVVDTDGISSVVFHDVPFGVYHVAVKHRNHLGAMTADPVLLYIAGSFVDFTSPNTPLHGQSAMLEIGGRRMLWSGDVNHDGELKYTGQNNDRDPILFSIGGSVPTNTTAGYKVEDINMDGLVKYTGPDNDRDPILSNIGGSVPTNTRQGQLP
jgi:uncharacterized delta-60 repeat protein